MAVRPVYLVCGQSNSGPNADFATWAPLHVGAQLDGVTRVTGGSYGEMFSLPAPGGGLAWASPHNAPVNLKGRAIRGPRYLVFYHPEGTGYTTYPHTGLVVPDAANTASRLSVTTVFDASAATGATQISLTRVQTGETRAITAVAAGAVSGAGSTVTLASPFTKTPTIPASYEQFTYQVRATANALAGATTLVLTSKFGVNFAGSLSALKLTVGVDTVTCTGWDDATRTVTFSPALTAGVTAGDLVTLAPITGAAFHKFALWLPWTPLRGDHVTGKENPFPRGFDYPGHIDQPESYSPNLSNTSAVVDLTKISYHVGLAIRLRELHGEEVYLIADDFGGTTLATLEFPLVAPGYGWHDPGQQTNWMPGKPNNCFARWCDTIDAGIAAAALEGDTLAVQAIIFCQGESDAGIVIQPAERYEGNLARLKKAMRDFIKSRGIWAGAAETIPWIQPKIFESATLPYADLVNTAIQRHAAIDPYMRTFSMSDATLVDSVHYDGTTATNLEKRVYAALLDLQRANDTKGVIDICNLALSFLGDSSGVTSIDPLDGSAQAVHCSRFFPLAFDEVLKTRNWTFASRRLDLTDLRVDSPWPQWPVAFVLPHDFLRVISLLPAGSLDDNIVTSDPTFSTPPLVLGGPAPLRHSVELDAEGRTVLYTVQEAPVLRYTARVPVASCPRDFRVLVAWKLAQMLAGAIVKGEAGSVLAEKCLRAFLLAMPTPDAADADSRSNDPPHIPFTLQGRG